MQHFFSIVSEFITDMRGQKLRVSMTLFGITWGTVAIIVLVAFGFGFKKQLSVNMHGIGEHIAIMFPGQTTKPYQGFGIGRGISFVEDDTKLIASQVQNLSAISPEFSRGGIPVRVGQNIMNPLIAGVYPVYSEMRNINPREGGRFINDPDMKDRKRVIVLGNKVEELLFGEGNGLGKLLYVGDVPFLVIGVMQKKIQNSSYNERDQDRVFIPATTYSSVFGQIHLSNIIFQVKDPQRAKQTGDEVREVLSKKYRFDPTDRDAVWIWDTNEFDKFLFYFFLAFNLFMGLIGSFTLGVGGVGVANIMYIVVQERTREIGIKRAVGAKRANILFQFFLETLFIIFIGSSLGFIISYGIIEALQFLPIKEFVGTPELSIEVALTTVSILSIVGFTAGLMPARRAAKLDVIECLR